MVDWLRGCTVDTAANTIAGGPYPGGVSATITMYFGPRQPIEYEPGKWTGWVDPNTGQRVDFHYGFDSVPPVGSDDLVALGHGTVTRVIVGDPSFGNAVECSYVGDDGHTYRALYLHLATQANVNVGDTVTPGQVLGPIGSTGASTGRHLHLQMWRDDYTIDPLSELHLANPVGFVPAPIGPPPGLPVLTRAQLGAALSDEANVHGVIVTRDEAALANAETYRVNILRDPQTGAPI